MKIQKLQVLQDRCDFYKTGVKLCNVRIIFVVTVAFLFGTSSG